MKTILFNPDSVFHIRFWKITFVAREIISLFVEHYFSQGFAKEIK